jgi:carbonic anhydrase
MTVRFPWLAVALTVLCAVTSATEAETPGATPTAREALGALKAGNDRFVRNASAPVSLSLPRRQELAGGQHPIAMVLSCADSRVAPEYIFNAGLGELFVVRTAGEVIDQSVLATLEFGADELHVPLLLVLGHESCGAVTAAATAKENSSSANMAFLLKAIQSARRPQKEREEIKGLVLANVEQVINDAMERSPLLQRLVDTGQLGVVGGYYELVSGRVMFSELVASDTRSSGSAEARP